MDNADLTKQLLEITKSMLEAGKNFHLSLTIKDEKSDFKFSTGSQNKVNPSLPKKKKSKYKSPSQKKRDTIRKQKYLETPSQAKSETPELIRFDCEICGFETSSEINFKSHTCFKCAECKEILFTELAFKLHMEGHKQILECQRCKEKIVGWDCFYDHMMKKHRIFICQWCDFTCSSATKLYFHNKEHPEENGNWEEQG
jgi:hypothetical protein